MLVEWADTPPLAMVDPSIYGNMAHRVQGWWFFFGFEGMDLFGNLLIFVG